MPYRWSARSRRARRYKCPSSVDSLACEHVLRDVWGLDWTSTGEHQQVPPRPYMDFWGDCVQQTQEPELRLDEREVAIDLVVLVKAGMLLTPRQICQQVEAHFMRRPDLQQSMNNEKAWKALAFALRLWLHVIIPDAWKQSDRPLQDLLAALLRRPTVSKTGDRLESDFCAGQLSRAGGFRIRPTDDLTQHLKMREGYILVFRHSSWLETLSNQPGW
jgi:hypothetical protein